MSPISCENEAQLGGIWWDISFKSHCTVKVYAFPSLVASGKTSSLSLFAGRRCMRPTPAVWWNSHLFLIEVWNLLFRGEKLTSEGSRLVLWHSVRPLNLILPSHSLQGWFQLNLFKIYQFPACWHKWFNTTSIFTEQKVSKGVQYWYNSSPFLHKFS